MNIVIAGPGALGTLLASSLSGKFNCSADPASEYQIHLLDHSRERSLFLQDHGLILEKQGETVHCAINITDSYAAADIIFICVKSHHVAEVVKPLSEQCKDSALVVFLQNGIGHLEQVLNIPCLTAAATTSLGANLVSPGHVRYAGKGITKIGLLPPDATKNTSTLDTACMLLSESDISCDTVVDINPFIWGKLMVNVGINALTALHNCPNGMLLEDHGLHTTMSTAVKEAQAVGRAVGISGLEDALEKTIEVCTNTAKNLSSMLQDVRHRRPTEIDAINGAIIKLAEKHSIDVPTNRELVHRIKQLEKSFHA